MIFDYYDELEETIEILLAIGSIIGILGLIVELLGLLFSGQFKRQTMVGFIIVSVILLMVCGLNTGIRYFRIY